MEPKLIQYKTWLDAEIQNAEKKILAFSKKGQFADASYWKGMLSGMERYTKKLTDLEFSEHKKEILSEITRMEKEIGNVKANDKNYMIDFLEGITDALVRCLEKLEEQTITVNKP